MPVVVDLALRREIEKGARVENAPRSRVAEIQFVRESGVQPEASVGSAVFALRKAHADRGATDAQLQALVQALVRGQRNHERHRKQPIDGATLPAEQELRFHFEKEWFPPERQSEASAALHAGERSGLDRRAKCRARSKAGRLGPSVVAALSLPSVGAAGIGA